MTNQHDDYRDLALTYHRRLPAYVMAYLNSRGIPIAFVHQYRLGWDGEHITIPITNQHRQVSFFKFARYSSNPVNPPEVLPSFRVVPELYGWERILIPRKQLVICQGEFDRLALEVRGLSAVTSTGTVGSFLAEWASKISAIPHVHICFHNDATGFAEATRVARMIPNSHIVCLPREIGEHGTVADYFVRLRKTSEDFERLLYPSGRIPEDDFITVPESLHE